MMLSCKDVTRLISESMDRTLPVGTRIAVRIHLLVCRFCARYRRQLHLIRDTVQRIVAAEDTFGDATGGGLSEERRERIKRALEAR
jgi:hypothetical protein